MSNKAKNAIIAGDYKGSGIVSSFGQVGIAHGFKTIIMNKQTITAVTVADQETKHSASLGKAAVGGMLFGVGGAVAGAIIGKDKNIMTIQIDFTDGKKSLAEVTPELYQNIMKATF